MVLEAAVTWLLQQGGGYVFNVAIDRLVGRMGLRPPPLTSSGVRVLLDDYYRRLEAALKLRLDEERIIKLKSAIDQLRRSSQTGLRNAALQDALSKFSEMTNLPEQGETAELPNAQLRCLSFLGIAAIHSEIGDPQSSIAENLIKAIYADVTTAKEWLGDDVIDNLLRHYPPPLPPFSLSKTPTSGLTVPMQNAPGASSLLGVLTGHSGTVLSIAIGPDGWGLASGSYDETIKLWDLSTGQLRYTLKGSWFSGTIRSLAFSTDEQTLVSGCGDGKIRLWDLSTGQLLDTLQGHTGGVYSLVFSPDGRFLTSGSSDMAIMVWSMV